MRTAFRKRFRTAAWFLDSESKTNTFRMMRERTFALMRIESSEEVMNEPFPTSKNDRERETDLSQLIVLFEKQNSSKQSLTQSTVLWANGEACSASSGSSRSSSSPFPRRQLYTRTRLLGDSQQVLRPEKRRRGHFPQSNHSLCPAP